jgi:hypothetical protein
MIIIDPSTQRGLQALSDANRPQQANIARDVRTPDGLGGSTTIPATTGPHPCRIRSSDGRPEEKVIAERHQVISMWVITFSIDTDVQSGDVVTVGTTEYRVLEPFDSNAYDPRLRVACVEL